jgi:phage terminase Nu1 subunit (DNA packaging protein)
VVTRRPTRSRGRKPAGKASARAPAKQAAPAGAPPRRELLFTKPEYARLLGLSRRQIDNLVADGCPRIKDGGTWKYPAAAVQWYIERKTGRNGKDGPDPEKGARIRYEEARARNAELDVEERLRTLLKVEDWDRTLERAYTRVQARLLSFKSRLAPAVLGVTTIADAVQRIEPFIRELIDALRAGDDIEDDGVGTDLESPPAPADAAA